MEPFFWWFCFSFFLIAPASSGGPCTGQSYHRLKKLCVQVMQDKIKATQGELSKNCRDFAEFTVCLNDSQKISYCDNKTGISLSNDTLVTDLKKKYFANCSIETSIPTKECRPDKAVRKLMECGSQFYKNAVNISDKGSSISLSALCPQVGAYTMCSEKSQEESNCPLGLNLVPHLESLSQSAASRYQILCAALKRAELQKGTTACDRRRFINDMFLCGYHFANIADVVGKDKVCLYYEKYQRCHNNSIETYGCAPPDQLYNDANAFFNSLTKRYGCNKKEGALNAPLVAHVELEADEVCDVNNFIGHFFQCASGFINATDHAPRDTEYICRMVSIYRHCVNGARHETHCNKPIAVQSHLTFMQNYILDEYEAVCVVEREAARLSYQRMPSEKKCDSDKAQKKYEFCAGDFMRLLPMMEIGTDNDRICQIRNKYRECLEVSSVETKCDYKTHGLSRFQTLTALLRRDYGIRCDGLSQAQKVDHGSGKRFRHQSCRETGFLKAIETCDHVFQDDAVLLKENLVKLASIRSPFVARARHTICLHVRDYHKCLMSTAVVYHCTEATADVMDFFKQKLTRMGINYCSSGHRTGVSTFLLTLVVFLGYVLTGLGTIARMS